MFYAMSNQITIIFSEPKHTLFLKSHLKVAVKYSVIMI